MKKNEKKKKKNKTINEIGWAIFSDDAYTWKRRPLKIFHYIKLYFLRLKYLKKYGCAETAFWETNSWFICVMKEILTRYRHKRMATPIIIDDFDINNQDDSLERNEKAYDDYLDKMLDLLNKMTDEYYWNEETMSFEDNYDDKEENAKNEFMEMFSKIFYHLWE